MFLMVGSDNDGTWSAHDAAAQSQIMAALAEHGVQVETIAPTVGVWQGDTELSARVEVSGNIESVRSAARTICRTMDQQAVMIVADGCTHSLVSVDTGDRTIESDGTAWSLIESAYGNAAMEFVTA